MPLISKLYIAISRLEAVGNANATSGCSYSLFLKDTASSRFQLCWPES